ncbi:conserved hypothetical protein [Candidatus Zixiibacteriota bacterium]|nr:conserved hypothetical protein [candidate division Zixibacteria bacterium]
MKSLLIGLLIGIGAAFLTAPVFARQGEIYGKIYTVDNDVLEGFIRWDKNEASWTDVFDGLKDRGSERVNRTREDRRKEYDRTVKIFGISIFRETGDNTKLFDSDQSQSGIRFGQIRSIIPDGDDAVRLILKSGEKVEFRNGSTDFGSGIRGVVIDDKKDGPTELYWEDIDKIDLEEAPKVESKMGKRLYGKVITRQGAEFTGFVAWDSDEVYDTDILDGRDRHRGRKIEFANLKSIERNSSRSSMVALKDGRELRLEDSNDIDSGNRGICVSDPKLGRIEISWDEFDMIDFMDPPPGMPYAAFDGGKRLHGTVYTDGGEKYTGDIRWDDDEESTWELLNGIYEDVDMAIEFGEVKSIEKISSRTSLVTLKDGRSFRLKGSNDIDSGNRGIFVDSGKDKTWINWDEFEKAEFTN